MNKLLQFKFPADLTVATFLVHLDCQTSYQHIAPQTYLKTYYDSFDWRLYTHGIIGECVQTKKQTRFILKKVKNNAIIAHTELHNPPRFSQQFKHQQVRNTLEPILEMRALLPICKVAYTVHTLSIIDADKKTILRLIIEEYEQLPHRLLLQAFKGYEPTATAFMAMLTDTGFTLNSQTHLMAALALQNRTVQDYSSKLTLRLEAQMPADVASKHIYRCLLNTIKANEQGTIADTDSEFLHDFRVAVRRTRSALSQLKNTLPDETCNRYRVFFSWLGKITSPTRDLDVYLLNFASYKRSLPLAIREHLNPLHDYLINKQQQTQQELAHHLQSTDYLTTLATWEQTLNDTPPSQSTLSIKQLANKQLRKSVKRVLKEGRAITEQSPAETLHELRKSCKKLRYLMEFFQSLYAKNKLKRLIKALKTLQDVLGDFQDCEVQAHNLMLFSAEMRTLNNTPAETFLAIEQLIATLETRKSEIRSHFALKFAEFSQPETLMTFKALCG